MTPTPYPLTAALLALDRTRVSYQRATQHDFLVRAGRLQLSRTALARWLTQDRLYALIGYSAFLGTLISKIPAPLCGPEERGAIDHRARLNVLAGAMANINREVGFFEQTARDNGLDLATAPQAPQEEGSVTLGLANSVTRGYIDYMLAIASRGTFEEGMVLLWAMEKLYLDAWTFAATHLPTDTSAAASSSGSGGVQRALLTLIPNWSSAEFGKFVDDIADLVDNMGISSLSSAMGKRVEAVWTTTLWYEERFWDSGRDE